MIDEVVVAAAAAEAAAASVTSVVGHFGPVTREAKPADSPTPATTTSSVPDQREVAEAVEEEVEAVAVVADDRPAVAGWEPDSCHKVPVEQKKKHQWPVNRYVFISLQYAIYSRAPADIVISDIICYYISKSVTQ